MACGTKISIFVVINERLYVWQKHCLNSIFGKGVCVHAGNKEMNVDCSLSYSFLRELSSCYCNKVGTVNHSILSVIQIGDLPQNILNWKLGMERNPFDDKSEHSSSVLLIIMDPAMERSSVSMNIADMQNNIETELEKVSW